MNTQISTDKIKDLLKEKNLRVTYQRILVFHELYISREHPTAEIIYDNLRVNHPMLSLGTVYKTLDCFYKSGLIRKLSGNDAVVHYDADLNVHTHIIPRNSDKIIDYYNDELNLLLIDYFKSKEIENFKITDFELNLFGEIVN
jgi:Fur family peroxide stress response transcriptional regulator